MKMEQSVPKRWDIKFRRRRITQKKAYKILYTKIFNQVLCGARISCLHYCMTSYNSLPPVFRGNVKGRLVVVGVESLLLFNIRINIILHLFPGFQRDALL